MAAEENEAGAPQDRTNYSYLGWAQSFDEALQLACREHPAMRFVGLGFGMWQSGRASRCSRVTAAAHTTQTPRELARDAARRP